MSDEGAEQGASVHAEACELDGVDLMVPNRLAVGLSLGWSALVVVGTILALLFGPPASGETVPFLNTMALLAGVGGMFAWYFARPGRKPSRSPERLCADGEGVHLGDRLLVRRDDIESAVLWPAHGGAVVRIERRGVGASVDLVVRDVADGRRLVSSLGFSASQAALPLDLPALSVANMKSKVRGSWLGGAAIAGGIAGAVAVRAMGGPVWMSAAVASLGLLFHFVMLARLFRQGKIVVGADGVHATWLWHEVLIPVQEIERVEVVEGEGWATMLPMIVRVHKNDGSVSDLVGGLGRTTAIGGFNQSARTQAETIAERIDEALQARRGLAPLALAWDDALLARGERGTSEWVSALRRIHDRIPTFREHAGASVFDRLWSVLEDGASAPAQRAAAAVALSPHLDDAGRERVRIAAQATATPKLRVALEAAAEDDDVRLIEALDEVAAAEEEPRDLPPRRR